MRSGTFDFSAAPSAAGAEPDAGTSSAVLVSSVAVCNPSGPNDADMKGVSKT